MWGLSVPLLVILILRIPTLLFHTAVEDPSDNFVILTSVMGPVGIGIAILKHRLMNIELVIRRTIVGAVVVSVFLFVFYLSIAILAGGMTEYSGSVPGSFMAVFLTAFIFTFLLQPVQQLATDNIDKVFFRNREHYRERLGQISNDLVKIRDPGRAAVSVIRYVAGPMEIPLMLVALSPEQEISGSWSHPESALQADNAPWGQIQELEGSHLADPSRSSASSLDGWMVRQGLDVLFPLKVSGTLIGLMACSTPRGKKLFSRIDVSLLANVAAAMALALSHSIAYQVLRRMNADIERMNAQLEERVEQRTRELEMARIQLYQSEKMASLGMLSASVAHEINTPLGAVRSCSEQMEAALASGQVLEDLSRFSRLVQVCGRAARRVAGIVQNLRDFTRPSQQDPEFIDLRRSIEGTLQILAIALRKPGVELVKDLAEIPEILCYPALLNQVFTNLLLNAAQAMPEDGGTIKISATPREEGGVEVVVQDSGPGVPEDIRHRIFEPFYTTKERSGGTGLGLSLCYNIIKEHGGEIYLDTGFNDGARFVVNLPPRPPS